MKSDAIIGAVEGVTKKWAKQRADRDEPVILVLHMACPRVEYTDRGKSAVVVRS